MFKTVGDITAKLALPALMVAGGQLCAQVFFDRPQAIVIAGLVVGIASLVFSSLVGRSKNATVETAEQWGFDIQTKVAMHFACISTAAMMLYMLAAFWSSYRLLYCAPFYAIGFLYLPAMMLGVIISGYGYYYLRKR